MATPVVYLFVSELATAAAEVCDVVDERNEMQLRQLLGKRKNLNLKVKTFHFYSLLKNYGIYLKTGYLLNNWVFT